MRAILLAIALTSCAGVNPGTLTVPLGPHVSIAADLSGITHTGSFDRVRARRKRAGFVVRDGVLYGAPPAPDGIGAFLNFRKEF